jgi:hypothetical protein
MNNFIDLVVVAVYRNYRGRQYQVYYMTGMLVRESEEFHLQYKVVNSFSE